MKRKVILAFCVCFICIFSSLNTKAYCNHTWSTMGQPDYVACSNGVQHKVITTYYCIKCYEYNDITSYKDCNFTDVSKYSDYESNEDGETHIKKTKAFCSYCSNVKLLQEKELCDNPSDYYKYVSSKKHKNYGYCSHCDQEIGVEQKHVIDWIGEDGDYHYECIDCGFKPKYNGYYLSDYDDTDNITIKLKKTKVIKLYYFRKGKNEIESITNSNKKVCTIKGNKNKIIFTPKKKGKTKIKVFMDSGAIYTYNVSVK